MNVLITGANGTVGSDLVNFFSKKNKVYAFYRTPNSASICCLELNAAVTLNSKYKYSEKRFKIQGSRGFTVVI